MKTILLIFTFLFPLILTLPFMLSTQVLIFFVVFSVINYITNSNNTKPILMDYLIFVWFILLAVNPNNYLNKQSVLTLQQYFSYALYYINLRVIINKSNYKQFINVIYASFIICIAYGLYQHFYIFEKLAVYNSINNPNLSLSGRLVPFSTFLYGNTFAGYLIMLMPLFYKTIPLSVYILYLTQVRGAIVIFIMSAFLYVLKQKWLIIIALISITYLLLQTNIKIIKPRAYYNKASVKIASDNLLQGVGINNYQYYYPKYREVGAEPGKNAHNTFLQMFAETGLLTGLIFLVIFLIPIFSRYNDYMFIIYLNMFLHNFTEVSFYCPNMCYIMFFLLAIYSLKEEF